MAINQTASSFPRSSTRAMRVSAAEAERHLTRALWLVALLAVATLATATLGYFA
jgi:hypothetical protein